MIAEAVRSSSSCSSRTMATSADPSNTLSVREEEGEKGSVVLPASKPTASPAPPNGELYHEELQAPAPVPVPLPTSPTPPPTSSSSSSSSASSLSSAPVSQPCGGDVDPLCLKEEEDFHASSEDEDKLVINEGCEKKEPLFHSDVKTDPVGPGSSQSELSSESPPKSPLKRPAEDADAVETNLKKLRVQEETETFVPASLAQVEESIAILNSDLKGLEVLLAQKEEEWNSLLRLFKKKEEAYIRILRKKQVLKMRGGAVKKDDEEEDEEEGVMFLPQGAYSSLGSSQYPLMMMMMKHMLGESYVPQVLPSPHKVPESKYPSSNGPLTSQNNISVIDIHTSNSKSVGYSEPPQISISPETHSKLGKQLNSIMPVKPILPKPSNCGGNAVNPNVPFPPLPYPTTGYGPQGPTVSVHHLIATHRKENPHIPPMRGAKRGAWRHRYDSEKRSSSREPDRPSSVSSSNSETDVRVNASLNSKGSSISSPAPNNMLPMNDPSVSYKDVLLQFAQLTQTEKQPGSPQISIIPVSASDSCNKKTEPIPDSTSASLSKEHPGTPQPPVQSSNLENSTLVKLLLESGAGSHGKSSAVDLSSYNNSSPHSVTLSALLSRGTTTTLKDKSASSSQMDSRSKKNTAEEVTTNPKCQGCHNQRAQFVCAGCGNQWYCSRKCQVTAWERHSEHCNS